MTLVRLILAVTVAVLAAGLFFPALAGRRALRWTAFVVVSVPILLSPLLVPADVPFLRFLAAVVAVVLCVKLYDLHIGAERGSLPRFPSFLVFLPNWMSLVGRKLDREPRPNRRENLVRLGANLAWLSLSGPVFVFLFRVDWSAWPFAVEHSLKVVTLFLVLMPAAAIVESLWRLAGGQARNFFDNPFLARTPADFWRRYNRPVGQFFYEDIFKPAGGLRFPIRATLLAFAVSAVIHEYVFTVAIGRVQGYQTAFFLLHGCAVAATLRVKPKGWGIILWMIGTLTFNLASGVLFFASVNEVVPFYQRALSLGL